jgi:hypothetical protein
MHREHHGGYRMRRLLQDEWTLNEDVFVYGGYRVLQRFPPNHRLLSIRVSRARLKLTVAERRLLTHAAAGMTDREIAHTLAPSTPEFNSGCSRCSKRSVPAAVGRVLAGHLFRALAQRRLLRRASRGVE